MKHRFDIDDQTEFELCLMGLFILAVIFNIFFCIITFMKLGEVKAMVREARPSAIVRPVDPSE